MSTVQSGWFGWSADETDFTSAWTAVAIADFENALTIRESELRQKEESLKIEEGQGALAQKERLEAHGISVANVEIVIWEP